MSRTELEASMRVGLVTKASIKGTGKTRKRRPKHPEWYCTMEEAADWLEQMAAKIRNYPRRDRLIMLDVTETFWYADEGAPIPPPPASGEPVLGVSPSGTGDTP